MKKIYIYIGIIILIIAIGVMLAFKITSALKIQHTSSENTKNNIEEKKEVEQKNQIEANNIIEEGNNDTDEDNKEKPKTDLEKAIEIVKEDWGPDESVYFAQDGKQDNKYIICVRDADSTAALAWYTVNVEDETFTKE